MPCVNQKRVCSEWGEGDSAQKCIIALRIKADHHRNSTGLLFIDNESDSEVCFKKGKKLKYAISLLREETVCLMTAVNL